VPGYVHIGGVEPFERPQGLRGVTEIFKKLPDNCSMFDWWRQAELVGGLGVKPLSPTLPRCGNEGGGVRKKHTIPKSRQSDKSWKSRFRQPPHPK